MVTLDALAALGACGDGGAKPADASPDTPIDTPPGTCTEVSFAGEVIDRDATNAAFCGVFGAKLTVRAQPARTDIHVAGTPRAVSLSTVNHSAAQQFNGSVWEPVLGSAAPGTDVLFPNVDVSGGPVTVSVAGGAIGATAVTLEAGVFTYLTVIAN
jgi:hypothetical protein